MCGGSCRHETGILALKAMIAPINVTRLLNGFKVWELAVIHLGAARLLLHKLSHSASQAMRFGFKKLDRCMLDCVPPSGLVVLVTC